MRRKTAAVLVVFDFDRTVTKRGTFTPFLLFSARREPWRFVFLIPGAALGLLFLAGFVTRKRLKERMIGFFLAGKSKRVLEALTRAFVERLLAKGVRPKALEAIREHQRQGHRVGLATASMDFYVRHVTRALKLDFEISTRSGFDARGKLVAKIEGENCFGEAKAARIRDFLAEERPGEVWFYSDHASDLPSFALAAIKVAVNPSARLAKRSRGEGWRLAWWD